MAPSTDLLHLAWAQLWQVSILILIAGGLSQAVSRKRPHLAFALWALVIVKCLMPPVWSSPTGVFSWAQLEIRGEAAVAGPVEPFKALPEPDGPARIFTATAAASPTGAANGKVNASNAAPVVRTVTISPWAAVLAFWLAGVALLTSLAAIGWRRCRRVLRVSRLPTPPSVRLLTTQIACRIGLRREVEIVVTSEPVAPCVFCLLRPVIVIPESLLRGRRTENLEPILAHELVHVRRGDGLFSLLQMAAQIVWWFHPLVWWANRQATRVTEHCCDVEVLAGLHCDPATYAKCLLDVLEGGRPMAPTCPGLRPAEVTSRRLEDIMRLTRTFNRSTRLWCFAITVVVAVVILPGARLVVGWAGEESTSKLAPTGRPSIGARQELSRSNSPASDWRPLIGAADLDPADQGQEIRSVAFASDGALIACAKQGGTVELRDARSGDIKVVLPIGSFPRAICGSADKSALAVFAVAKPAELQFWDVAAGTLKKTLCLEQSKSRYSQASFARDGSAVIASENETFSIWNTNTGKLSLKGSPQVTPKFIEANVQRLNEAHSIWKARHPEEARRSPHPVNENLTPADCTIRATRVALSPNGTIAAIGIGLYDERSRGIHCAIQLWDVSTGKLKHALGHGNRAAFSVAFSSSGRLLAVGEGGAVALWDVSDGKLLQRMDSEGMAVFAIAISPDEQTLAGCGDGRQIEIHNGYTTVGETKIWDRVTGQVTHTISGGSARGEAVDFSPNGKWVVRSDFSTVLAQHTTNPKEHWILPCGIFGDSLSGECLQVDMTAE